jgi:hypothetical protein
MNPTTPERPAPKFHNPDNLESAGEGWRFLVEWEEKQKGDEVWMETWWSKYIQPGIPFREFTYRTKRPLP